MRKARIWLLFWIGHIISKPMEWFDWGCIYPAYNWCMSTSCDLDDDEWMWKSTPQPEQRQEK